MTTDADLIANTVLAKFRDLPRRFKPRSDGTTREWVPIAGIVLRNGMYCALLLSLGQLSWKSLNITISTKLY